MTKLVDSIKDLGQFQFKDKSDPKDGNTSLSHRLKVGSNKLKGIVTEAQKYDPGSKYLGVSGLKGVDSRKTINKREKAAEKDAPIQAAAQAAREKAEYDRTHPMPITDSEAEKTQMRKKVASQRRSSGRLSTVLSDTLG